MKPYQAYNQAEEEGYSEELEDIVCQDPNQAYLFAKYILGANIEKCMKATCRNPNYAYWFFVEGPENIPQNIDISYCLDFIIPTSEININYIIENHPYLLELLKDKESWKDIITQEMIDQYQIEQILT